MSSSKFNAKPPLGPLCTYHWQGINLQGKKITGEITAFSLRLAKLNLQQQGIILDKIVKKPTTPRRHLRKKISAADMAIFLRQLATLINANIPILQAVELLLKTPSHPQLHAFCKTLKQDIESGKTIAQTLQKFPGHFAPLTCHLIHLGEQSGTLAKMLTRAALLQEKKLHFKKKLQSALFYPSFVLSMAFCISLIMLVVIVPRFVVLFQSMHGSLPMLTRWVIKLSDGVRHDYPLGCVPLLLGALLRYYYLQKPAVRGALQQATLKIPLLGGLLKKIHLSRFAFDLAMTLSAGTPLLEALKMIAQGPQKSLYDQSIYNLHQEINQGQPLHRAMEKVPLFSVFLITLVKIGEESGSLEIMLEKATETYEAEIDHFISNFHHVLEPLIMIVLGVLIGGLVIAMYLPIFKLGAMA